VVSLLLLSEALHITQPPSLNTKLLSSTFGRLGLLTVALIITGVGAVLTFYGLAQGRPSDLVAAPDRHRVALHRLGRVGFIGRGMLFAVPGVVISAQIWLYSPAHGGQLTDSIRHFLESPVGSLILILFALALLAFAAYEFIAAKYRRVPAGETGASVLARTRASMRAGRQGWSRAQPEPRFVKVTWARAGILAGSGILLFAATAGVGILIVRVLTPSIVSRWDNGVSEWFYRHRTPTLNQWTNIGSMLSDTMTAITMTAVAVVVLGLWLGRWRESIVVVVAIEGELLVFLLITAAVARARPVVPHLDAAPPTSSFPSGHTGAAVALYGCIAIVVLRNMRRRWLAGIITVLCFAVPVIVGLSRIYRGMHFTTDVMAGAIAGGVWLTLVVTVLLAQQPQYALSGSRAPERERYLSAARTSRAARAPSDAPPSM
jgi:membrane-associated phospholipid phosphatase